VSQQDPVAPRLQAEQQILEERGHGAVRRLDQQVVSPPPERGLAQLVVARGLRPVHIDLGAGGELEPDAAARELGLERGHPVSELRGHHAGVVGAHVRRGGQHAGPVAGRGAGERDALLETRRPVVQRGEHVRVQIDPHVATRGSET
jgi:hypothetical protein